MPTLPLQAYASMLISIGWSIILMAIIHFALGAEKKRPTDRHDDH